MGFSGALRFVHDVTQLAGHPPRWMPSDDGCLVVDVSQIIVPVLGTGERNALFFCKLARFLVWYFYVSFSILSFIMLFLVIYVCMHVTPYYISLYYHFHCLVN